MVCEELEMGIHPKIGITGLPRSGKSAVLDKVVSMVVDEHKADSRSSTSGQKVIGGMRTEAIIENGERVGYACIDIETGKVRWSERHSGRYSASLVEAGGRLYACDEDGTCIVFKANPQCFEIVSENKLDDGCMASPAVLGDDLVIRTRSHLYRICSTLSSELDD